MHAAIINTFCFCSFCLFYPPNYHFLYIIKLKATYTLFCLIIFSSKKSSLRFEFFMTVNIKIIVF
jgi:hypothetical protein